MDSTSLWEEWRIMGIFTVYLNVNLNSDRKYKRRLKKEIKNQCRLERAGLLTSFSVGE